MIPSTSPALSADPDRLLGLAPEDLIDTLGRPSLVRRDPPAEIWQFHDRHCILDVFFYAEGEGLAVAHLEARQPDSTLAANAHECLRLKLQALGRR